jgi:hypothetical protein
LPLSVADYLAGVIEDDDPEQHGRAAPRATRAPAPRRRAQEPAPPTHAPRCFARDIRRRGRDEIGRRDFAMRVDRIQERLRGFELVHFVGRVREGCGEALRLLRLERAVEIGREPLGRVAVRRGRILRACDRRMKRRTLGRRPLVDVRLGEKAFKEVVESVGHGGSPSRH